MENGITTLTQETPIGLTNHQVSLDHRKCRIVIIILTVLLILCIVGTSICCCLLVNKNSEVDQLLMELEDKEQYIASLLNNDDQTDGAGRPPVDEEQSISSDPEPSNGLYWELGKIGMRIPITQELADNITLVELDDSYRLDLNLLVSYREQGYCANGGSTAFGNITKTNVSRDFVQDSPILYNFVNNVVYPKTYIAYNWYGEFTVCWDLGEGGQERHDEVERLVQRLQEPLTQAIEKIEPIK